MKEIVTGSNFQNLMNCGIETNGYVNWDSDSNTNCGSTTTSGDTHTYPYPDYCWDWWREYYYPTYYPVYYPQTIHEDKGKKAIEVVKALMETKTIQVKTIKQFVELLDKLMKIL